MVTKAKKEQETTFSGTDMIIYLRPALEECRAKDWKEFKTACVQAVSYKSKKEHYDEWVTDVTLVIMLFEDTPIEKLELYFPPSNGHITRKCYDLRLELANEYGNKTSLEIFDLEHDVSSGGFTLDDLALEQIVHLRGSFPTCPIVWRKEK